MSDIVGASMALCPARLASQEELRCEGRRIPWDGCSRRDDPGQSTTTPGTTTGMGTGSPTGTPAGA
jgi:hypothetical protein